MLETTSLEKFSSFSETYYERLKSQPDTHIVLFHFGDLSESFSDALSARLELELEQRIAKSRIRRQFFSIFLEILQNIRVHGVRDSEDRVFGCIAVHEQSRKIRATFSNIVSEQEIHQLLKRYNDVNSMSRKKLKELYLEVMDTGVISDKGGAGLGLMRSVLKSKNPCIVNAERLSSEYHIFQVEFTINMDL